MIETMPLNPNGHLISRTNQVEVLRLPGHEDHPTVMNGMYDCAVCGDRPALRFTKDAVYVQDPCPYPDGLTTTITLAVPSGKLLVADSLRPIYNDRDIETSASYNSSLGKTQTIEAMAALGCAFGPVGNSSPGLYRTGPDSYIIASPGYDDDDIPSLPESDCLAGIVTDLWAYAMADYKVWERLGGDPANLGWTETVVDVTPGTYQFTHHTEEHNFNRDAIGTVVFADVRRIS